MHGSDPGAEVQSVFSRAIIACAFDQQRRRWRLPGRLLLQQQLCNRRFLRRSVLFPDHCDWKWPSCPCVSHAPPRRRTRYVRQLLDWSWVSPHWTPRDHRPARCRARTPVRSVPRSIQFTAVVSLCHLSNALWLVILCSLPAAATRNGWAFIVRFSSLTRLEDG